MWYQPQSPSQSAPAWCASQEVQPSESQLACGRKGCKGPARAESRWLVLTLISLNTIITLISLNTIIFDNFWSIMASLLFANTLHHHYTSHCGSQWLSKHRSLWFRCPQTFVHRIGKWQVVTLVGHTHDKYALTVGLAPLSTTEPNHRISENPGGPECQSGSHCRPWLRCASQCSPVMHLGKWLRIGSGCPLHMPENIEIHEGNNIWLKWSGNIFFLLTKRSIMGKTSCGWWFSCSFLKLL